MAKYYLFSIYFKGDFKVIVAFYEIGWGWIKHCFWDKGGNLPIGFLDTPRFALNTSPRDKSLNKFNLCRNSNCHHQFWVHFMTKTWDRTINIICPPTEQPMYFGSYQRHLVSVTWLDTQATCDVQLYVCISQFCKTALNFSRSKQNHRVPGKKNLNLKAKPWKRAHIVGRTTKMLCHRFYTALVYCLCMLPLFTAFLNCLCILPFYTAFVYCL